MNNNQKPIGQDSGQDDGHHVTRIMSSQGATAASTASAMSTSSQSQMNSLAIRQEIQRFESVHPAIYAIYDLLEMISDPLLAQQCRENLVQIEDSFVNSQEWTLSRTVPDLRLGIVGSLNSGKSALVHRYLTGSYMQDESPEGGRFKKEVIIDGQSYLLLIRDEGGPPEMQFSLWCDAVIFVFSLDNEESFNLIYNYYTKMFHYRNTADVPIILVGTQEGISETTPRVIDENKAKKLASELKRCSYYETCSTYGLNVEKVFQEACHKIVHSRVSSGINSNSNSNNSRSNTPNPLNSNVGVYRQHLSSNNLSNQSSSLSSASSTSTTSSNTHNNIIKPNHTSNTSPVHQIAHQTASNQLSNSQQQQQQNKANQNNFERKFYYSGRKLSPIKSDDKQNHFAVSNNDNKEVVSNHQHSASISNDNKKETKDLLTPSSTPTTNRKNRRRSNLFPPLSGSKKHHDDKYKNGEVGSGRDIPVKQGYLYKKSQKTLNKEWKKKYVTLTKDGSLTYYPTLHDYMEDVHGKTIPLKHTTVKIPGLKPRGSRASFQSCLTLPNNNQNNCDISSDLNHLSINSINGQEGHSKLIPSTNPKIEFSHKKRHRRGKSHGSGKNGDDDSDGNEFRIVSLENKQWQFEAVNTDDRDNWVSAIEQQILSSLQNMESEKSKYKNNSCVDQATIQAIRTVPGNTNCIDCDYPNPDWASLNLGSLICIECSGIHRNLGTHISKVRSLELDDWPPGHISVMMAIGNSAANGIWEHKVKEKGTRVKPTPNSSRDEKEKWIRAKYNQKEFLKPINESMRIEQQLIDAIIKSDVKQLALVLAHLSTQQQVNLSFYTHDMKTPLHLATARGNLAIVQLLLWSNANPKAIDGDGKTALFYAKTSGHLDVEDLLKQNGCLEINGINNTSKSSNNTSNYNSLERRRNSLTSGLTYKTQQIFDKLPASII